MLVVVALIFAAVFLGALAVILGVAAAKDSPASAVKRRLRTIEQDGREQFDDEAAGQLLRRETAGERLLYSLPLMRRIQRLIVHSGAALHPPYLVFGDLALAVVAFLLFLVWKRDAVLALLAAVTVVLLPLAFLSYQKKKRQALFTEQLPEALSIMARSLRAGHSLTGAIELAGEELPAPCAALFQEAYEQQKLGMRITEALASMADKIESMDLHFFTTIIRINSETGGNLAEILEKLAETIRARLQIRRQVEVFTAEGRISGYILVLLPAVLFLLLYLMRREFVALFFTNKTCQMCLFAAMLAQVVGYLVIRKIVNIRI